MIYRLLYVHTLSLKYLAGVSSLGVPGVPWHTQILADQLTLSQPGGADYAHQIILAPPDFQTIRRPCLEVALREKLLDFLFMFLANGPELFKYAIITYN